MTLKELIAEQPFGKRYLTRLEKSIAKHFGKTGTFRIEVSWAGDPFAHEVKNIEVFNTGPEPSLSFHYVMRTPFDEVVSNIAAKDPKPAATILADSLQPAANTKGITKRQITSLFERAVKSGAAVTLQPHEPSSSSTTLQQHREASPEQMISDKGFSLAIFIIPDGSLKSQNLLSLDGKIHAQLKIPGSLREMQKYEGRGFEIKISKSNDRIMLFSIQMHQFRLGTQT